MALTNDFKVKNGLTVTDSISAGSCIEADSFEKHGGTSSQFLKADGSVDSSAYTTCCGDVTGIDAGTAITVTDGNTATPAVAVNSTCNSTWNAKTTCTGTVTSIATGTGIGGGTITGSGTLTVGAGTGLCATADGLCVATACNTAWNAKTTCTGTTTPSNTQTFTNKSGCISQWTNDCSYGKITCVTGGTNLTGSGSSGTVTLNMATGGAGSGTYGCTSNNKKIDTITLDAYGRVTAVAVGATCVGDITSVTAGTGMTGGGTSGDLTLNVIGGTGITANANDMAVDCTVVRTTGCYTIGPSFPVNFQSNICIESKIYSASNANTLIEFGSCSISLGADGGGSLTLNSSGVNAGGNIAVTGTVDGRDVAADGLKLDGIACSANNYSLPEATATVRGGIELFSNTDQSVAANVVTSTASRTYGIQLNSSGQAVVNVPWSNTNSGGTVTSIATGTGIGGGTITGSGTLTVGAGTGLCATADGLCVATACNTAWNAKTTCTGTVDTSGTPVDNDFAKFTDANTIEGRSCSEVRSDLGIGTAASCAAGCFLGINAKAADSQNLDGIDSTQFLRSDATDTATGALTLSNANNTFNGHHYFSAYDSVGNHYPHYLHGCSSGSAKVNIRVYCAGGGSYDTLYVAAGSNNITWRGNTMWNAANDGSGSGLDADLLDGCQGSFYNQSGCSGLNCTGDVRTTGTQSIGGAKTFTSDICIAESLTHSGDTDTRVQFGTNTIYAIAGGEEVFRVDNTGMVVNEQSYGNDFRVESETDTYALFVDGSADKVGIGTANPSKKLHVAGDGLFTSDLTVQGDLTVTGDFTCLETTVSLTSAMDITNTGTGPALVVNQTGSNDIVNFQDDGTSAFYIEDGGNVGIGDTNPAHKLDVAGSINATGSFKLDDSDVINSGKCFVGTAIADAYIASASCWNACATSAQGTKADNALPKAGGTMSGAIAMGNSDITGVNQLCFNDPGPNEGVVWCNTKIYESPDNLTTNSAGNLQMVYGSTRRLTVNNTGIDVNGNIVVSGTVDGVDVAALATCSGLTKTGTVTSIATGTGIGGGTITGSGTLTVGAGTGLCATANGLCVATACNTAWNAKTTCTGTVTSIATGTGIGGGTITGSGSLTVGAGTGLCATADGLCVATACNSAWNAKTTCTGTVSNLGNLGITATAAEVNYTTDVTSNIQAQLNGKLSTSGCAANAALLDGIDSAAFLRSNTADTLKAVITVDEGQGANIAYDLADSGVYIPKPIGADHATSTSAHTGAIAIKLPTTSWSQSDMISFYVDIYDYAGGAEGESVSLHIYGYPYSTGYWTNVGALVTSDRSDRDYTVRFGNDGTRHIVYIGETTSTWNYLQVNVRDFHAGYGAHHTNWDSGWDVAVNVTSFSNIQQTSSDNYPYAKSLKGLNSTVTELNYSDGVTSNIQTQLNAKQASGTYNTIIGTDSDINTSGCQVVDQLVMTDGVITSHSTRNISLANLGYTGATNANYITNNNQLTNGAGYTTCTGTGVGNITCVTTSTGLDGGASSGTATISLDLSELTDMTAAVAPASDELILLDSGAERRKLFCEIFGCNAYSNTAFTTCLGTTTASNSQTFTNKGGCITQWTNNAGYTTCAGDITSVVAGNGLTGGATSGGATLNVGSGTAISINADSIEVCSSCNSAWNAKTTCTGTVTCVVLGTGTGLDGGGTITTSGSFNNITLDLSELTDMTAAVVPTTDEIILLDNGAERRKRFSEIFGCNAYSNTAFTTCTGDITSVTAGNGLTGGASSGGATLNVGAGTAITVAADTVSVNSTCNSTWNGKTTCTGTTTPSNTQTFTNKSGCISQWTNDSGYVTSSGTVNNATCAGGLVVGTGRNNSANQIVRTQGNGYAEFGWINTTSGANTTQAISRIYASSDSYIRYYTPACFGAQIGSHINYNCLTSKPTIPTNNNQLTNGNGYTTCTGDITSVTAGSGLTGGASSGGATLNVGAGTAITVAADTVSVNSTCNSTWNGKTTCTGTTTPSNTQTFTNKSGCISQWTNNSGYTTCTGTTTPSNSQTFTNKSGCISQWTNNSGYTSCTGNLCGVTSQCIFDSTCNFCIGPNAGEDLTSGISNTLIGKCAGRCITTGQHNISIGSRAGEKNCTKHYNISLGYQAGYCGSGCGNFAAGQSAMQSSTASNSVSIGKCSLQAATGNSNVAIGSQAGQNMSSGYANMLFGAIAGFGLTTGSSNVYIGDSASRYNASGGNNVAIGKCAGRCYNSGCASGTKTSGSNNIYIGTDAKGGCASASNEIVIGCGACGCGSNSIRMGNTSISSAYINTSWNTCSDVRDKTCIADLDKGLCFIGDLHPKSYMWRCARDSEETRGKCSYGFLAQDILALEGEGIIVDDNNSEHLSMKNDYLIPILVKGMQDQQDIINKLEKRIEALEA